MLLLDILVPVQLLRDFSDELVPLIVPAKSGGTQAIRVVLADSKEDRELLEVVHGKNTDSLL